MAVALLAVLAAGCALKLISDYDPATDQGIAKAQETVDGFLVRLARTGAADCAYPRHSDFYADTAVQVRALLVRNRAREKNALTIQQLELLESSLAALEARHRQGCPTSDEIEVLRRNFATSFTAMLRLEMAKTRARQ